MFKQRGEQKGDKPGKFAENLDNAKIKASLNLQLSAKNGNTMCKIQQILHKIIHFSKPDIFWPHF